MEEFVLEKPVRLKGPAEADGSPNIIVQWETGLRVQKDTR